MTLLEPIYPINHDLNFLPPSQVPLNIRLIALSSDTEAGKITKVCLKLQVNLELYQQIEAQSLFNLKPDLKSNPYPNNFQAESDIIIEVILKPALIDNLPSNVTHEQEITNYLLNLSQSQINDPLLYTESWFILSVKQQQETGEVEYKTFWYYLNPALLSEINTSEKELTEGITNFFQELISNSLESKTQEAFGEISHIFSQFIEEITEEKSSIFQTIINFFTEDDWSFMRIQGDSALRLFCQGDNGQWNCYAQAREEQQQFIFYSIYPQEIPEAKRTEIAEFITRANYGLIIGNFEMDFDDGEIRYKTSIDVEGNPLTSAVIKQLVYTNVMIMDKYLPGIIAVVENNISPEVAISDIEQKSDRTL